jgi:hypothetical protein
MITINMTKAKEIAHDIRREERAKEFAPLDIKATIPTETASAEATRATIRTKYETMQTNIDLAIDVEALKTALENNNE